MFENKASSDQSTSPPSRGRSPLDAENSETSTPVSKVRASFVAVERPGQPGQAPQWGLRKASDVTSISGVNGITEDTSIKRIHSETMANDVQTADGDLGVILKGSPFESDEDTHTRQAKDLGEALSSGQAQKKISEINTKKEPPSQDKVTKAKSPTTVAKPTPSTSQLEPSKTGPPVKSPPTRQVPPSTTEKSPVSPKAPHAGKVNTTHPAPSIRGIRGGPAKIMAVMDSANKARVEREKKSPVTETKPDQTTKKDAAPKTTATNGVKKEPGSTQAEKIIKPPTQPTKLPAAATTPTAASVARTDGPPKTLTTDNRRVSAVRKERPPPKVASTTTVSSLAKRTPRNSLAPQTNGHERPKSRVSTAKDESFLARMTRPTASSQQKVHEKVVKPESPPRVRKVSDKVRHSLGPAKDKSEDKENGAQSPVEATKAVPEVEAPVKMAVAQEAT
jgi:hypothetical protein